MMQKEKNDMKNLDFGINKIINNFNIKLWNSN